MTNSCQPRSLTGYRCIKYSQRGMTLIEVLIALGILAAVAVIFLVGMSVSSKGVMVSQERVAVDSLAKSEIEYIKSVSYHDAPWQYQLPSSPPTWDPTHSLPSGYTGYSIQVNATSIPGLDINIQQITVTITHGGDISTLVSYKVNR